MGTEDFWAILFIIGTVASNDACDFHWRGEILIMTGEHSVSAAPIIAFAHSILQQLIAIIA